MQMTMTATASAGSTADSFTECALTATNTRETGALAYVVCAEAMKNGEFKVGDAGFAINGGMVVNKVIFDSHQIESYGAIAHAMGEYVFTDAISCDNARVEYTFAYTRCTGGQVRICLHHMSVPSCRNSSLTP